MRRKEAQTFCIRRQVLSYTRHQTHDLVVLGITANLIDKDKTVFGDRLQHAWNLRHLIHECAFAFDLMIWSADSRNDTVNQRYVCGAGRHETPNVSQKNASCHLAYVGWLAAHVRSRNYVDGGLARHHNAVIADAAGRILKFNQGVPRLQQMQCSLIVNRRFCVLLVGADQGKSC